MLEKESEMVGRGMKRGTVPILFGAIVAHDELADT